MIKNFNLEEIKNLDKKWLFQTQKENKKLYGEVYTPFDFADKILSVIPPKTFANPHLQWLDPGSGTGNFSIVLYYKLLKNLILVIPDIEERKNHIIKNMIHMVELREENIKTLKFIFGNDANIYEGNFLNYNNPADCQSYTNKPLYFDVIIGNPPFNSNGLKKVPTNYQANKKYDGNTIWISFIIKSISLLKQDTGLLCMFIPSIWLKPDKLKMYEYLTQYDIQFLNCLSNTETNKIFKGDAQTPSCYFLLTKRPTTNMILIYDKNCNTYINYYLNSGTPIPVFGQKIIKKLQRYCFLHTDINNAIRVIKTNMPRKNTILMPQKTEEYKYPNITTCKLKLNTNEPELIINYSNKPLIFSGVPKLILAHKMYGFPYLDISGRYGISNRDNYIIIKENPEELKILQKFLSTKTALYLFEATRYRMKYLERYAFQLIPDITRLAHFPREINDETIAKYFGFDQNDKEAIQNLHKKNYKFFV
jgi:tRNA1(Val) A37 N6-methylase TrmN6